MIVVDCSIIIANTLADEKNSFSDHIMEQVENNTLQMTAPSLIYLECSNVLYNAYLRKRINKKIWGEYIEIIATLPIEIDYGAALPESMPTLARLIEKYSLTAYDAAYLELAQRKNILLATLDKKLSAAATKIGIAYPPH